MVVVFRDRSYPTRVGHDLPGNSERDCRHDRCRRYGRCSRRMAGTPLRSATDTRIDVSAVVTNLSGRGEGCSLKNIAESRLISSATHTAFAEGAGEQFFRECPSPRPSRDPSPPGATENYADLRACPTWVSDCRASPNSMRVFS